MCVFSPYDDIPDDLAMDAAFDFMRVAERNLRVLVARVRAGATCREFPRNDADAAIHRAVGDVEKARSQLDRLLASRVTGTAYPLPPGPSAIRLEMQRQVVRNEEAAGLRPASWLRPAFEAVDAASADAGLMEISKARGVGLLAAVPSLSAVDSASVSPASA